MERLLQYWDDLDDLFGIRRTGNPPARSATACRAARIRALARDAFGDGVNGVVEFADGEGAFLLNNTGAVAAICRRCPASATPRAADVSMALSDGARAGLSAGRRAQSAVTRCSKVKIRKCVLRSARARVLLASST